MSKNEDWTTLSQRNRKRRTVLCYTAASASLCRVYSHQLLLHGAAHHQYLVSPQIIAPIYALQEPWSRDIQTQTLWLCRVGAAVLSLLLACNAILTYIEFSTESNREVAEHVWEDVEGYVKIYEELGSPVTFSLKQSSTDVKEGERCKAKASTK